MPTWQSLVACLLALCVFSQTLALEHETNGEVKRVAIIGGGIGGTSASYQLKQQLQERVEIFLFEQNDYLGGRVNDITFEGVHLEIGGSIYHECNQLFAGFVKELGLTTEKPLEGLLGLWNGHEFVLRESAWQVVTWATILYRYMASPVYVRTIAESVKGKFCQIYDNLSNGTFNTVQGLFQSVGLEALTRVQTRAALLEEGIDELFINEMVTAITRINYGQDVSISALAGYVSLIGSGEGLYAVKGGNKQVMEGLVRLSEAIVQTNTRVLSIEKSEASNQYLVKTLKNTPGARENEGYFDAVIIAAPLESANITLRSLNVLSADQQSTNVVKDRPYQRTCVTVVAGKLNPSFFGLPIEDQLPDIILTVESSAIPFNSIAAKRRINKNETVYKIFSRSPLSDDFLDVLFFSRRKSIFRHEWQAYPVLDPNVSRVAEWPPIILDDQVVYVNALESAVSTIETEAISSKNAVNALLKQFQLNDYQQDIGKNRVSQHAL